MQEYTCNTAGNTNKVIENYEQEKCEMAFSKNFILYSFVHNFPNTFSVKQINQLAAAESRANIRSKPSNVTPPFLSPPPRCIIALMSSSVAGKPAQAIYVLRSWWLSLPSPSLSMTLNTSSMAPLPTGIVSAFPVTTRSNSSYSTNPSLFVSATVIIAPINSSPPVTPP
ncbi:hypothetical protein V8G54_016379 [Vigna mungo]|uniref:Uncharacterized protein n=1 Tax=Vigna mungo TaxID=3915 RepID=A0AAQ3NK36_VIGMU